MFHETYTLFLDSSLFANNISVASKFLKNYKISLKKNKYKEATKIAKEFTELVEEHIDITARDVRWCGMRLREKKLYLESILIFDAASSLSKKIENPEEKLEMIRFCVQGMKRTNEEMIEDDAGMKVVMREYVIPLMRNKLSQVMTSSSVSKQYKCLEVSWVLHYIEWSHYLVDQLNEQEQTQREAIRGMDEVFGENKIKYWVYGVLLHNLGTVCHKTTRYEEAASFYKQAIDAHKAATDYDDEEERKRNIELNIRNLSNISQKPKCLVM